MPKANTKTPARKPVVKTPAPSLPVPAQPVAVVQPAPTNTNLAQVVYDKVEVTEYSVTSKHGPLTVQDAKKDILGWETEEDYQKRMVAENPGTKPEHWLFGDVFHCLDTDKKKVRCWNNANNRPFDMAWCEDLIHTLLNGNWAGPLTLPGETVNGETVRISKYGRVLSGQHQCTALTLADELLQKARQTPGYATNPRYPFWEGHDHVVLETLVVTGLSEDERVLRTIDYVKPRTTADMLFTMELFRQNSPTERKDMTRTLASAIDMLWTRTDTKGYRTHPEVVGFLERHRKLLETVEHLSIENSAKGADGGRKISKLRISLGHAAAMCYLMGCSSKATTDYSDEYRNESPPTEKNLDWSYWDKALDFWTCLAGAREFIPVRRAIGQLVDSSTDNEDNIGLGGRVSEKMALIAKAWEQFKDHPPAAGPAFDDSDLEQDGTLSLSYSDLDDEGNKLPDGRIKLLDVADFYGIDCPASAEGSKKAKSRKQGAPMPPAPTKEEIEKATEEALRRRMANQT